MSVFDEKWRGGRKQGGKELLIYAVDAVLLTKTYTMYKQGRVWDEGVVAS